MAQATQAHITRRALVKALPFIGAAVAVPTAAVALPSVEPEMTPQERIEHHVAELRAAVADAVAEASDAPDICWTVALTGGSIGDMDVVAMQSGDLMGRTITRFVNRRP